MIIYEDTLFNEASDFSVDRWTVFTVLKTLKSNLDFNFSQTIDNIGIE